MSSDSTGNSTIFDEDEIEEWGKKLGRNGIKVTRVRPRDEEFSSRHRKDNHKRRERMNTKEQTPVTQNPPPPRPENRPQPRPIPFLEKITHLSSLQEKRDKLQEQLREIEAERSQVLSVRREAESQIYAQLNEITPRELGFMQSRLIPADEEEAREIQAATVELSRIANNAQQTKLATNVESYFKTGEAFRLIWQGLTPEQREERALTARVSPDHAKAFYRAALAYHQEELAAKFLEMIPSPWRADIEGKAPISAEVESEAEN